MRLRKVLAGAAAGVGLAALANRRLASQAGPLPPALVGEQRTYRWRGFDVAYAEAGDPDDPDVLLVHGIHAAGSSVEFDGVFEALAEEYHVVAPDLPGFGRSDRPPATYTASLYEEFVRDFATDRTDDATCIATSLAGAYAARVARDGAFARLVLVCPTDRTARKRPLLRAAFRAPLAGEALFNALVSRPSIEWFDAREGYYGGADRVTVDYQWRTTHQEGARYAPASFVGGYLDPAYDLGEELAAVEVPVTLVWGREATVTPLSVGRALADRADARLVVIDRARLLPHDEHPDSFLKAVEEDLPRLAQ
ncbi:MAG: alpha/beta fold hydrolase [Halobacteriaceae archaeon]